jgi:diadenosine hexaphosphate hydrolase (ATP-forming)
MTRRRPSRTARSPRSPRRVVEGAGGVVVNDAGAVLLIRHRNGSWVFPKGHIEAGESKVDAAVREVEEEAGVQAVVVDPRQTWQTEYVNPRREGRRITWYLLRTQANEAVMREAIFPTGGFFDPEEALPMLAFEEDRQLLRHALRAARRAGIVPSGGAAGGEAGGGTVRADEDHDDEVPEGGDPAAGEAAGDASAPTPGGD